MGGRRQSPLVLGSLFTSGATWVTISLLFTGMGADARSLPLVLAAVAAAYLVGVPLMVAHRWDMPPKLAYAVVVLGTIATTMVVAGGPVALTGAHGGFYGYVAAYSFLYFSHRAAAVQWLLSGVAFAVSMTLAPVPHPTAHWITVMGIAAGGAGLLGVLAARLREQWEIEHAANAREAELVALRSTFLQAISHELRTPLTAVVGFARTLEQHASVLPPETVTAMHGRIRERAEKLSLLLQDLLDLERMQRGHSSAHTAPTELAPLLTNALQQVDHPNHVVMMDVSGARRAVQVEAPLIERILVNLLANAVAHTPPGTTVQMRCTITGDDLNIEVLDNGPGVPPALRASLFDPFVQGDDAATRAMPGTGIGLALVRHMAELHGGSVSVGDAPGGGAHFHVVLPGVVSPRPTAEPAPVAEAHHA